MPHKRTLVTALLLSLVPACALAQSQKPVQLIVPFAPGASADGIARAIAPELGARLGKTIVIENRPGAGGTLGLMAVAKAAPDGDMLTLAATGALVINPHIPGAPPIDPLRDVIPVAKLIDIPIVLVANPKVGPKSIAELIAQSKTMPGGMSYGTTGPNSSMHIAMELLRRTTGANLVHVPYRGSAPAVTNLLGGQIPIAVVDITSAYPHIQAGTLRALGVVDSKRAALAPEIPTLAEAGVPGFGHKGGFMGVFTSPGTPDPVVKKLTREIAAVLAMPEVQAKVRRLTVDIGYLDDAAFAAFLAAESAKWKEAIKAIGVVQ
jgi:tripartite-type tricarboxylate transporter receptor subunit TctC